MCNFFKRKPIVIKDWDLSRDGIESLNLPHNDPNSTERDLKGNIVSDELLGGDA